MSIYAWTWEPWRAVSVLLMGRDWSAQDLRPLALPGPRTPEFALGPLPSTFDAFYGWLRATRGQRLPTTGERWFSRDEAARLWAAANELRNWRVAWQSRTDPFRVELSAPFAATLLQANARLLVEAMRWDPWWRTILFVGHADTRPHPDPKMRAAGHRVRDYSPILPLRAVADGIDLTRLEPPTDAERRAFYGSGSSLAV
jgi:hypothetical protein